MPQTYKRAFGLRDNPFGPKELFPGVSQVGIKNIFVRPLRLDHDVDGTGLCKLFVPDAGPFGQHFEDYKLMMTGERYIADAGDGVSSAGNNTFIFIVRGPKGTGKTTLMNLMIRHLKRCRQPGTQWMDFKPEFGDSLSEVEQSKALDDVKDLVSRKAPDYCYFVLDNLVDGASWKAFDLYQKLSEERQCVLFITTHDEKLMKREWDNWGLPILSYNTAELSADNAVAFVRSRVALFRDAAAAHLFEGRELFPFNEGNIRRAVQTDSFAYDPGTELITLRQFSKSLSLTLDKKMLTTPDLLDYGAAGAAPALAANFAEHEIDLIQSSRERIERVAA